jgi:hypothetical protein
VGLKTPAVGKKKSCFYTFLKLPPGVLPLKLIYNKKLYHTLLSMAELVYRQVLNFLDILNAFIKLLWDVW